MSFCSMKLPWYLHSTSFCTCCSRTLHFVFILDIKNISIKNTSVRDLVTNTVVCEQLERFGWKVWNRSWRQLSEWCGSRGNLHFNVKCRSVIGRWRLFTGYKHGDSASPEEELQKPLQPVVSTELLLRIMDKVSHGPGGKTECFKTFLNIWSPMTYFLTFTSWYNPYWFQIGSDPVRVEVLGSL